MGDFKMRLDEKRSAAEGCELLGPGDVLIARPITIAAIDYFVITRHSTKRIPFRNNT